MQALASVTAIKTKRRLDSFLEAELIPSEARFLLGLQSHSKASGRTSRMRLYFCSYSSATWSMSLDATSKDVGSLCEAYKLYGSGGLCSLGESIFVRLKMIVPSWLKVVHPFADGDGVTTCGQSIIWPTLGFWRLFGC